MRLPKLPSTISLLSNDDAIRVNALPYGDRTPSNCLTCGGTKKFKWYVYASEGQFEDPLEIVEYECPCEDQWILSRKLLSSGIGLAYQRYSMFDIESSVSLNILLKYINKASAYLRQGTGMFLVGPNGTGKSLMAIMVSKQLIKKGCEVHFTTFSDLIVKFTDGWKNDDAAKWFYNKVKGAEFLVIDDIGQEMRQGREMNISNVARQIIDDVLRFRVSMALPTIITTNNSMEKISQAYGSNIFSLLQESSLEYQLLGEDYRPKMKPRSDREVDLDLTRPVVL